MHSRLQSKNTLQKNTEVADSTIKKVAAKLPSAEIINNHQHQFNKLPLFNPANIQPKLSANSTNVYEREADSMANSITNVYNSDADKKTHINKKEKNSAALHTTPSNDKLQTSQSHGFSMDLSTQSFMENKLGHNFSNIKIHNDTLSNQSAKNINALAYTQQNNIVFGANQYKPQTNEGKKLLAHELTHTIQQNNDPVAKNGGVVQRFASEEHQHLGDVATGKATYNLGSAADKFELTHGDIVALSGDVFLPDELFKLAATPGDKGTKKNTQDEILWALQDPRIWEMRAEKTGSNPYAQKTDPRFQKSGLFGNFVFSEEVKNSVFEKYQKLGAANASHFVAPKGRDKSGAPIPADESAGSKYIKYHEGAISTADKAGRAGSTIDMPMANEAAAQHYLTDSFSAGHLRTPITLIREYWGNKYPLFWYNLRHKISLDTGIEMAKGHTVVTNNAAYTGILGAVEAMAPTLPAVTLGDLIASIYHDVDNESGVNIKGGGKIFGDKKLDATTEKMAVDAIKAGNNDITKAFDFGKTNTSPVPDKDLFDNVRKAGGGTKTKYAAELLVPQPDTKEPSQNWKASDVNALWDQKFLGKSGDTVGKVISQRVQGGSIAIQLMALAEKFPADDVRAMGQIVLHPRDAYINGFVKKLQANPKAGVLDIVNWAPHDMWTGDAEGDVVKDLKSKGDAGNKTENLVGMSNEQRIIFVKQFLSDGKPGFFLSGNPTAHDNLITLFENISTKERKQAYNQIEGHAWNGNIKAGDEFSFKIRIQDKGTDKDVVDKARVDKFKKAMNSK